MAATTFLFTSESVNEGHPGTLIVTDDKHTYSLYIGTMGIIDLSGDEWI